MARFNVRIHCCVWFPLLSNYCCMYTTSLLWFFLLLIYAPMWPDLAKFCHFGTTLKNFAHFETFILDLEKLFNLLWQNLHANGQILIVGNGQISTNNPATWSHCICPFLRQFVHANLYMPICSACLQGEKTSESFDSSAAGFNKVKGRRRNQVQKEWHCQQHRPRRMHPRQQLCPHLRPRVHHVQRQVRQTHYT